MMLSRLPSRRILPATRKRSTGTALSIRMDRKGALVPLGSVGVVKPSTKKTFARKLQTDARLKQELLSQGSQPVIREPQKANQTNLASRPSAAYQELGKELADKLKKMRRALQREFQTAIETGKAQLLPELMQRYPNLHSRSQHPKLKQIRQFYFRLANLNTEATRERISKHAFETCLTVTDAKAFLSKKYPTASKEKYGLSHVNRWKITQDFRESLKAIRDLKGGMKKRTEAVKKRQEWIKYSKAHPEEARKTEEKMRERQYYNHLMRKELEREKAAGSTWSNLACRDLHEVIKNGQDLNTYFSKLKRTPIPDYPNTREGNLRNYITEMPVNAERYGILAGYFQEYPKIQRILLEQAMLYRPSESNPDPERIKASTQAGLEVIKLMPRSAVNHYEDGFWRTYRRDQITEIPEFGDPQSTGYLPEFTDDLAVASYEDAIRRRLTSPKLLRAKL